MRALRHLFVAVVAMCVFITVALAQEDLRPGVTALRAAGQDPMDLAAALQRGGETVGYALLGERAGADEDDEADETPEGEEAPLGVGGLTVADRLLVVRAAPYLRAPELALPGLARFSAGRDPDLAPAAAESAHRIVSGLDFHALDAREYDRAALAGPREAFEAIAADDSARGDLRGLCAHTARMLALLESAPNEE